MEIERIEKKSAEFCGSPMQMRKTLGANLFIIYNMDCIICINQVE